MPKLHAIDGCPAGWLVVSVSLESGSRPRACIVKDLEELGSMLGARDLVAIDMPIGLKEADTVDHSRRECDVEARQVLGGRACCLFYAPARGVLGHLASPEAASSWHKKHTDKALPRQTFHILKKVKLLDQWLQQDAVRARRVYEVHPEVSFAHWAGGDDRPRPLRDGKKTHAGRAARLRWIEAEWPGAVEAATASLGPKSSLHLQPARRWQEDDLLDAFAALWTLRRIAAGTAKKYPPAPTRDSQSLTMCIWA